MTFPVTIWGTSSVGSVYTLKVDDVYHAQIGLQNIVTIGGNPYTITDITYGSGGCNSYDTLKVTDLTGANPITATSFNMYAPFFFYGTLNETGTELSQQSDSSLKTPMIFLRLDETLEETFHYDQADTHERDTSCEIAFLTQGIYNTTTSELLDNGVTPMRRLMDSFISAINDAVSTFEIYSFNPRAKYYTKVYVRDSKKQLWSDQLSGVWDKFQLKILK